MAVIRIYEPALCCNTGVCGTDIDEALVTFTADVKALEAKGVDIARANLATDPMKFGEDPAVIAFMQSVGSEGLPLTLVDGVTVATGRYPSRAELCEWAGCADSAANSESPCCADTPSAQALPLIQPTSKAGDTCCGGESCCS
ncbi:arsenite efflux transporter metallochaperone ArsD [Arcanobacterium bovis]|uniref:Arsenite efflux transporter metallochaperone ArsD n=1 Tax=Arcanobacterium bovis TaxID=2529275 RepID=A0A4Q9UZC2_9ACTO|nr:arsenite efflux transporter metallochaperone ArsD [Arcanobacterium bovis]TBW21104.1 arsenite efflux transporter metallochaperone ArsD [Arcanobacterium bovis]